MNKTGSSKDAHILFILDAPDHFSNTLGVELLVACLKRAGFRNISHCGSRMRAIRSLVKPGECTFIAFSTNTLCASAHIKLARKLKREFPHVVTLFGGPHPTFEPEMIQRDGVDALCRGEAEESFVAFLDNYDYHQRRACDRVPGWWVKDADGIITRNPMAALIEDIDKLPIPDRNLGIGGKEGIHFIFSRGCPNSCSYCSVPAIKTLYQKTFAEFYRVRSVENCLREIKAAVARFGRKQLFFHDSIFGLDRQWLREFSSRYAREIKLPFYCHATFENIDERYVRFLKAAGCTGISFGLETADESVRKKVLNKNFTNAVFRSAVQLVRAHGMEVNLFIMTGLPGGTIEDDLRTVAMAARIKPDRYSVHVLSYLPGTAIRVRYSGALRKNDCRLFSRSGWPVLNSFSLRKDIVLLLRLQSLATLTGYLHVPRLGIRVSIFNFSERMLKILISLPIFHICNLANAVLLNYSHYKEKQRRTQAGNVR